ncbi:MAG TPA: hypothetical protein VFC11_02490, partial [Methylocella sp.]|nr:hypothetical protein [Methylocella sp.]
MAFEMQIVRRLLSAFEIRAQRQFKPPEQYEFLTRIEIRAVLDSISGGGIYAFGLCCARHFFILDESLYPSGSRNRALWSDHHCRVRGGPGGRSPDPCPTGNLDTGTGQDLVINKECHAGSGKYLYGKVNIIKNGKLIFDEKIADVKIDFWASSILVENEGSLIAGTPGACDTTTPSKPQPFGCNRGMLAIHLYGKDQGNSGVGITCKSSSSADAPPCGIPGTAWNSNGKKRLPCPAPSLTRIISTSTKLCPLTTAKIPTIRIILWATLAIK